MSIEYDVSELKSINNELKSLTARRKKLNDRKKVIENNIKEFLKSKGQVGVRHRGDAIVIEDKPTRARKKEKEKEQDALEVLERYGIHNAKNVLDEILEARRGEYIESEKIKLKKPKKKKKKEEEY